MGAFLDHPKTDKKIETYQHRKLRACSIEMQGWRKNMEDAILYDRLDKEVFLFGVFDGHGGAECAQFCAIHFAILMKHNKFYAEGQYGRALSAVFMELDELMDSEEGEKEMRMLTIQNGMQPFSDNSKVADSVGCTANVVMLAGNKLIVANAGDSRSALSRNGTTVELSKDHKPDDPKELERILASNAVVEKGRINSHLNLSRCIGDLHYKRNAELPKNRQTIISEPDIFETELCKEDEFIIIGCDGIWERYENKSEDLLNKIRSERFQGKKPENVLGDLLDGFLSPDPKKEELGCDNMSCVLIEFNKLML